MQSDRIQFHRVSGDGLEQTIREIRDLARRRGGREGERLRSVVEFLLRPSLVQVQALAAMGSAYTDPPVIHRPKGRCPSCGGWLTLTPKGSGYIFPTHKISAHAGRCRESGTPARMIPQEDEAEATCDV